MAKQARKKNFTPEIVNRKARFDYEFLEVYTAGIALTGSEVKAIREGKANLTDAFCTFFGRELMLVGAQITPYSHGGYANHEPKRHRALLLTKKELSKLRTALQVRGMSIVVYRLFFSERGFVKAEIALARGKKTFDKRETIKERDVKRANERE
jgi:SsrA-binding protein